MCDRSEMSSKGLPGEDQAGLVAAAVCQSQVLLPYMHNSLKCHNTLDCEPSFINMETKAQIVRSKQQTQHLVINNKYVADICGLPWERNP